MESVYEELFQTMSQFRAMKFHDLFGNISRADFFTMNTILDKGEEGKITISELASKAHVLPPAMSRTLRGLEDKGYVQRSVNQEDRRNTYVELTEEGERIARQMRETMCEFGQAVMSQIDEEEIRRLISCLNYIYAVAEKEIEARKNKDRKDREHEQNI